MKTVDVVIATTKLDFNIDFYISCFELTVNIKFFSFQTMLIL